MCGLLGVLLAGSWVLIAVGAGLAIWLIVQNPRVFLSVDGLILVCTGLLLWLRYQSALLLQYDDFSHWGTIVRHLLAHQAFPDGNAKLILFQSYPPAAACWIYFVCRFCSEGDGMMLAAQAWWVFAGVLALAGLIAKPHRSIKYIGLLAPALIVLSLYQGTASLMVDNLIAALAIGAVSLAVFARNTLRKAAWPLGMVLATLALVKDSGLFFAAICVLLILILVWRRHAWREEAGIWLPIIALPAVSRLVWWIHLKLAFPAAELTKHAFSIENLRQQGADKSFADMLTILKNVFVQGFSLHNQTVQMLLLTLFCCLITIAMRYRKTRRVHAGREALLLLGGLMVQISYLLSLWAMYTFTLPLTTALRLVAFERYNSTCALFSYGALAAYMLTVQWEPVRRLVVAALGAALMLAVPMAIPSYRAGVERLFVETYQVPIRQQLEQLDQKRPLRDGENAVIYLADDKETPSYIAYMARYVFQSDSVTVATDSDLKLDSPNTVVYAPQEDAFLKQALSDSHAELVLP